MAGAAQPTSSQQNDRLSIELEAIRTIDPTISRERALSICSLASSMVDSASTLEELVAMREETEKNVRQLPGDHSRFFAAMESLRKKQIDFLARHDMTPESDCSPEMNLELNEMLLASVREGFAETSKPQTPQPETCKLAGCRMMENLRKCSGCKKAMYCSVEHQRMDWPRHRQTECIRKSP